MRSFAGDFFKLKLREKWLPRGNEAAIKSPKYMVLAILEIIKKRKKKHLYFSSEFLEEEIRYRITQQQEKTQHSHCIMENFACLF